MCGISAIICKNTVINNSIPLLINSLANLQNRGYDSFGISAVTNNNDKFYTHKKACINQDVDHFQEFSDEIHELYANICIGHTRWATHGVISEENAHPHLSNSGKICLVHNGIIENYKILKKEFIDIGFTFNSDTDSEIIVNLIDYYYINKKMSIEDSIYKAIYRLEGTYGLAIQCLDNRSSIYVIRNGSPILVGENENYIMATSEKSGFLNQMNNYYVIENNDLVVLSTDKGIVSKIKYNSIKNQIVGSELSPSPYEHWTIKEIMEQPVSLLNALNNGARIVNNNIKLGGLDYIKPHINEISNIILLGCGTSLNACQIGRTYLKLVKVVNNVQCFDAAEFELTDIPLNGKTLLIMCSQSGETKDLHRIIHMIKDVTSIMTLGVINVVDSLIAREVDCGIYMNAGREVAVASTKSFTSSLLIFKLFSLWYLQNKKNIVLRDNSIQNIRNINNQVDYINSNISDFINDTNISLLDNDNVFILGKSKMEHISKEMALKMKEICYIHAEGYSGSALKHGPFALLKPGFPVILLIDKNNEDKMWNVYKEIQSRRANILVISEIQNLELDQDKYIVVPENQECQEIIFMTVLQHICYRLSLIRGINPDKPRNLAKVVTVE
jgi:glucosamine--fructose-6-phosphate aminotransferase (isomerizing)